MMLVLTILVSTISSYVTAKLVLRNVENKTIVIEQPIKILPVNGDYIDKIDISEVVNNIKDTIVEVYTESTKFSSFYGNI